MAVTSSRWKYDSSATGPPWASKPINGQQFADVKSALQHQPGLNGPPWSLGSKHGAELGQSAQCQYSKPRAETGSGQSKPYNT